ncbi:MAG: hypothetical protein IKI22_03190 [Neisseriaceae bacterium]|nr:hypothetical protein [Neisseriaceae bacterium]
MEGWMVVSTALILAVIFLILVFQYIRRTVAQKNLPSSKADSEQSKHPQTPSVQQTQTTSKPTPTSAKPATQTVAKPTPANTKPATQTAAKPTPASAKPATKTAAKPTPASAKPATQTVAKPTPASTKPATQTATKPTPATAKPATQTVAKPTPASTKPATQTAAKPTPASVKPTTQTTTKPTPASTKPATQTATKPTQTTTHQSKKTVSNLPDETIKPQLDQIESEQTISERYCSNEKSTIVKETISMDKADYFSEYLVYKQFGYSDQAANYLGLHLSTLDKRPHDLLIELCGLYLESSDVDSLVNVLDQYTDDFSKQELEVLVKTAFEAQPDNLDLCVFAEQKLDWSIENIAEMFKETA